MAARAHAQEAAQTAARQMVVAQAAAAQACAAQAAASQAAAAQAAAAQAASRSSIPHGSMSNAPSDASISHAAAMHPGLPTYKPLSQLDLAGSMPKHMLQMSNPAIGMYSANSAFQVSHSRNRLAASGGGMGFPPGP
uniref:Uncharacterized protein n=1 Tax=Calcidiscus leptoporus TaxID=127549 RepID=A0A7S0NWS8_9EUKA|mmetsp:Transcript_35006/g.81949  ORF Transcript_35006/g.81949 Transcript_35006/m.81949 type:complete len:137 (+) Transcript_35006:1-411(+)